MPGSITEQILPIPLADLVSAIRRFPSDAWDKQLAFISLLVDRHPLLNMEWGPDWIYKRARKLVAGENPSKVHEAIHRYGTPEIFNTDQGSQFTSLEFTQLLKDNGINISMDGKGCWRDNVFVERLWKSIKYEEVYLRAYETVSVARGGIGCYLGFYNSRWPHSALDGITPDAFYFAHLHPLELAA